MIIFYHCTFFLSITELEEAAEAALKGQGQDKNIDRFDKS